MAARALSFSQKHMDRSAGYLAALARLAERLEKADQAALKQRTGMLQVRAATAQKRYLRRSLRRGHLAHIIRVARMARREEPELAEKFVLQRGTIPFQAFLTAARLIATEAQRHRDLLVRYGMVESVLEGLLQALEQFDVAIDQELEGRRMHVGARAELDQLGDEAVGIVRILDALNRLRFEHDAEALAAWLSASNVIAPSRGIPSPAASASDRLDEAKIKPAA